MRTGRGTADRQWVEVGIHRTPLWTFWSLWTDLGLWQIAWQPPGPETVVGRGADDERVEALDRAVQEYFSGQPQSLRSVEVDPTGWPPFFSAVYHACREIPPGRTIGYAQLAAIAGRPRAVRAVGQAMARNRVPLVIPCHRVIGSAGDLGGFSAPGGVQTKRTLLELEQSSSWISDGA